MLKSLVESILHDQEKSQYTIYLHIIISMNSILANSTNLHTV